MKDFIISGKNGKEIPNFWVFFSFLVNGNILVYS